MKSSQTSLRKTGKKFVPALILTQLAAAAILLAPSFVQAHGFVESPSSRSFACYGDYGGVKTTILNASCKDPYEPQGVEFGGGGGAFGAQAPGAESFPRGGPANGDIAAGGLTDKYGSLNQQSANRWSKTKINPGVNQFKWYYTADHATAYWQFFITKKGWNPNQPLTRDSFEAKPIAEQKHNGTQPNGGIKHSFHKVNVPNDRAGYHVILATWKTADTSATFYQVIDVDIQNGAIAPSLWKEIGSIRPDPKDLKTGDVVTVRVMTTGGNEESSKQTVLEIQTDDEGKSNQWPHKLATMINQEDFGYKVGQLDKNDQVKPAYGTNNAYVQKDSNVTGIIVDIKRANVPFSMEVSGMQSSYQIASGNKVTLHFDVNAIGDKSHVENIVFNSKKEEVARSAADVEDGSKHFSMPIKNALPGNYDMVTVAKTPTAVLVQKTSSFKLIGNQPVIPEVPVSGGYDFSYPQGVGSYKAGTKVLQPNDGNTYQCKPAPYSGWCNQSPAHYAPGVGSNWKDAWTKVGK